MATTRLRDIARRIGSGVGVIMHIVGIRLAAVLALTGALAPAGAQTAATPPKLTAAELVQMSQEAGFPLTNGRPVNRCGTPANPRIAFIDLNGDGVAEIELADVEPSCYAAPGAYFAILARQPDGNWRRVIAEDGIVAAEATRTHGWADLSLEAKNSRCPGKRHFNGTAYDSPAGCAVALANGAAPASASSSGPVALSGDRAAQLAQLLANLIPASRVRSWEAAMAAFPGARWQAAENHAAYLDGSTRSRSGAISLGGAAYRITLSGKPARVNQLELSGPDDDNLDWEPVAAAMARQGTQSQVIGCLSPTGFGYLRLTAGGQSAILFKSFNYGSEVPSTDEYAFMPDDPFQGSSEAEVAADTSLC